MLIFLSILFFLLPSWATFEQQDCSESSLEAQVADIALTALIDDSCVGVNKDYIKKIFSTQVSKERALMQFQEQSFCFRKSNGKVAGCNLSQPRVLASVTKAFSTSYLYQYHGNTQLKVSAGFNETSGEFCLRQDGLTQFKESHLDTLFKMVPATKTIASVCLEKDLLYEGYGECEAAYSQLMHSQTDSNLPAAAACADTAITKRLFKLSGKEGMKVVRGHCSCKGEIGRVSNPLKDLIQQITATSDSWQIKKIFDKLGPDAILGYAAFTKRIIKNDIDSAVGFEGGRPDVVGNSSETSATCESILELPTIKDCQHPPLPCGDTPGATFGQLTSYSEGTLIPNLGPKHNSTYESFDDDFCGKTGSSSIAGIKNLVGCFSNKGLKRPIQSFALLLHGKKTEKLKEMGDHSMVLKDFYQHLLNPETQKLLLQD